MQFYKNLTTITLAVLLTCLCNLASAGTPAVHVSAKPTWLSTPKPYRVKPSERIIENGYYYALVERQIDVDRQADYRHIIREVISEAGIQNGSQINIGFDPAYERLDFHQITIWRNGKPINRLNPKEFKVLADERDFSKFIYQGSYSANYIIPDTRKGDQIEYAYTISGRNPVFADRFTADIYLEGSESVVAYQYVMLQHSAKRHIAIKNFNKVPAAITSSTTVGKRYIWEKFQIKPEDYPNNTPAWYNTLAHIQVSEFSSWGDVAAWGLRINQPTALFKGELAARVAKLKSEAGADKEKYFREATKIVQDEVRYMGIEIGEYSHRANSPDKVYAQRYGDCKDKALLLVSMLRAAGIDANMVLVNSSLRNYIAELMPSTNAFNHAVVTANVNGNQVWVDATISYQRGKGADIYFPDYGKGLILKAGTNSLTDIKPSRTGKTYSHEKYTVKSIKEKVALEVTTKYTDNQADDMRSRLAESGIGSTEKSYLKYYAGIYPKIEIKDSLIVEDDPEKNVFTTTERYLIPDFFKADTAKAGKYNGSFYANLIDQELPGLKDREKAPLYLNYPYAIDYTIEAILPSGWDVTDSKTNITRDAYAFKSTVSSAGNSLLLHYELSYLKSYLPADKVDEFNEDIKKIRDNDLSFSFSYTPDAAQTTNASSSEHTNALMLALALFVAALCATTAVLIYKKETAAIVFEPGASFIQIGGWLYVVLLILVCIPIGAVSILIQGGHFTLETWNVYLHQPKNALYRSGIVVEVVGNTMAFCYAIFCIVLFINKRDILPKAIIGLFIYLMLFRGTDAVIANSIHQIDGYTGGKLIYNIIWASVLTRYFIRSERVAQTFIVPYPHNNFSYEPIKRQEPVLTGGDDLIKE